MAPDLVLVTRVPSAVIPDMSFCEGLMGMANAVSNKKSKRHCAYEQRAAASMHFITVWNAGAHAFTAVSSSCPPPSSPSSPSTK